MSFGVCLESKHTKSLTLRVAGRLHFASKCPNGPELLSCGQQRPNDAFSSGWKWRLLPCLKPRLVVPGQMVDQMSKVPEPENRVQIQKVTP